MAYYDKLLVRAMHAFVSADYHPFKGIEDEIHNALASSSRHKKMAVLKMLQCRLRKSDLKSTQELADDIGVAVEKLIFNTAHDAYWFLYHHPKLNCRVRTPESPAEAARSKRKGFIVTKDKNGQHWREWRHEFHRAIEENLSIFYTLVDDKGEVNDDRTKNVNPECWLELGHLEWGYMSPWDDSTALMPFHDVELDCGGPTFDAALIELANLAFKHYGNYRLKKNSSREGRCSRPCADCKWLDGLSRKIMKRIKKEKNAH